MSKLVIVESPAKAKTIEKYLGEGFVVRASVGHVRDLPKSNKNAVDIEKGFVPHYQIVPKKKDIIKELKQATLKADEIILATDPDREGEAIAWHLAEALDLDDPKRIVFHEITEEAVQDALKHPRDIDTNLRRAQEARRVLDRLVGYDLSGLIWKKVRYGLSAGRVQSPALRILMEREREIRAFIPETYWVITAHTQTTDKEDLLLTATVEPRDKKDVDRIVTAAEKENWSVADVTEKETKRNPRPPFTTATLQRTASSRLGFSPSRTMRVAQRLYEAGHITYMRTDSINLAKTAQDALLKKVKETFGDEYVEKRSFASKSKNVQEAHEAVRPTNPAKNRAGANDEQKKLYELIWTRAIASQMKPANIMQTKIIGTVQDNSIPTFTANGSRVLFPGWLAADTRARGEDVELPKVAVGDALSLKKVATEEKETQPPSRYTEAGLVKELEKRGIGRPSTYASIIRTLEDRHYVTKEGRTLYPTDTGDVVSSFLEEHFANYISDSFTSDMEDELDEIALGERGYEETLSEFYTPFQKAVAKKAKEAKKITDLGPAPKEFPCPKCGKSMVIKLGRAGKFMSCSTFPECDGARTIDGEEIKEPDALGKDPETGELIYVLDGPYGPYVQLGKKEKGKKPKRASIPNDKESTDVTLEDALTYLALPRTLGTHPETGEEVIANVGRFGPYIGLMTKPKPDYRSLKEDDPYTITFDRALEILKEPKKRRGGNKKTGRSTTSKSSGTKTAKKK